MPSISVAQRRAMAMAKHQPSKLYKRNKGLTKMSKGKLSEFAETPEKGLPEHAIYKGKKRSGGRMSPAQRKFGKMARLGVR